VPVNRKPELLDMNYSTRIRLGLMCMAGCSIALLPEAGIAAGTAAGSTIQNIAQVSYDVGGTSATTNSNAATISVAEMINVNVSTLTSSVSVTPGDINRVLQYRLTNIGNGPEKYSLSANSTIVGDDFDPVLATSHIYFDTDGVPGLSPGDTLYVPGVNDPNLLADASIVVLVINNIPPGLNNGAIGRSELSAASFTGGVSGVSGQIFSGQGTAGVDAVLGTTAGRATSSGAYVTGSISLVAVKSQVITNSLGNNQPIPTATITYQVVITASGNGTANNALFTDAIPANTTYVPGTLKLNGITLTDAADTDAGQFVSAASPKVSVALGTLTSASSAQTVSFAVTIN
jgi:uncharacterized repeat protein (TIGR01451 family)